jgi:hypothetical protein
VVGWTAEGPRCGAGDPPRPTESRTLPLVIRVLDGSGLPRTVPIKVRVSSPRNEMVLDATFKSGGAIATSAN